jgi:4-hydroxy-tetrahydrodipicolinate synthase
MRMTAHRLTESARGVFTIAVTPFTPEGVIDFSSLDRLIDFYVSCGVHGITLLGMMGEAQKLSAEESAQVVTAAIRRVAGAAAVVVGVSSPSLERLRAMAEMAMVAGAAGVMVAPTRGLTDDDRVVSYFSEVCAAIGPDVPIVYQDFPQATASPITVSGLLRIVQICPQVVVLKHEDCPGLDKITDMRVASERRGLRRISVLVGNGGLYYPLELQRGADGAMTGFAYPEMLVEVFERFDVGDVDGAEDLFDAFLPLVRYEQQPVVGLAVRKEILHRRRVIASAALREPGYALSAADHAELDRLIARLERRWWDGRGARPTSWRRHGHV